MIIVKKDVKSLLYILDFQYIKRKYVEFKANGILLENLFRILKSLPPIFFLFLSANIFLVSKNLSKNQTTGENLI